MKKGIEKSFFVFGISLMFVFCFIGIIQAQQLCDPDGTGICWTFAETLTECTSYPCSSDGTYGYYANGAIWVSPPTSSGIVTLTATTPAWTGTYHGTMINPSSTSSQGFMTNGQMFSSSGTFPYSASVNIATQLPYALNPSASSAISVVTAYSDTQGGGVDDRTDFEAIAIITIVDSPPNENEFRPPWAGTDKSITINNHYTKNDLDYSFLTQVPITSGSPSMASAVSVTSAVYFDFGGPFPSRFSHPRNIASQSGIYYGYQCDIAQQVLSNSLLLLMAYDNSQKEDLYINYVQWGIDFYGAYNAGVMSSGSDGGHATAKVLPIYIAGYALGDSNILGVAQNNKWNEQCATWFVESSDWYPTRTVCGKSNGGYGCSSCTVNPPTTAELQYNSADHPAGTAEFGQIHCAGCSGNHLDDARLGRGTWTQTHYRYTASHYLYALSFVSFTHNQNAFGDWGDDGRSGRSAAYEYMERHMANRAIISNVHGMPSWAFTFYDDNWDSCQNGACLSTGPDTTSPSRSSGAPTGTLASGTTQTTISLTATDASGVSECRYSTTAGTAYSSMTNILTNSGGSTYSATVSVTDGNTYNYYIRCIDTEGNENTNDYPISFSVASAGCNSVLTSFSGQQLQTLTGNFEVDFTLIPGGTGLDFVTGLSNGLASGYSDLATIVWFNPSGLIQVRNGGSYSSDQSVSYSAGTEYFFEMIVDMDNHLYDVYVTPEGGSRTLLADDYAFRTEQASVSQLDYVSYVSTTSTEQVCDVSVGGGSSCTSGADSDGDSIVSIGELLGFISSWKSGSVSIGELLSGIGEWKGGC